MKTKDRFFDAVRYLGLFIIGAILASHGPSAKAADVTVHPGQEYWAQDNCLYTWDGYAGWPTNYCRSVPDPNNGYVWMQYDAATPTTTLLEIDISQTSQTGYVVITFPSTANAMYVAVPWRGTYMNVLQVEDSAFYIWVANVGWVTKAQMQAMVAQAQSGATGCGITEFCVGGNQYSNVDLIKTYIEQITGYGNATKILLGAIPVVY
jgi:hypothetical protein